jgi:hypothetical protein
MFAYAKGDTHLSCSQTQDAPDIGDLTMESNKKRWLTLLFVCVLIAVAIALIVAGRRKSTAAPLVARARQLSTTQPVAVPRGIPKPPPDFVHLNPTTAGQHATGSGAGGVLGSITAPGPVGVLMDWFDTI